MRKDITSPLKTYLDLNREGWVQERDVEILELLYKFKFLPLSRIRKLKFTSKYGDIIARRRLRKMYEAHMVDRFKPSALQWKGDTEYIYCLDRVGIYFVAAKKGIDVEELNWRKRDTEVRLAFVEHILRASEVYMQLRKQARIEIFEVEYTLQGNDYNFRTDAFAVFTHNKYKHFWFIENDQGTEWKKQIERKVQNYEAFYRENYKKNNFVMPYVVFVTVNDERVKELKAWVDEVKKIDLPYLFKIYNNITV